MVTNTAEIRSENIDSRTATFERKRPYDVASRDDISHAGSAESTPRKRKKHAAKLGIQDLRDSIPNGGSSNLDSAPHEEPRCGESESPQEAAATSAAPPMTWNAVNGTKLRTSLGGGLGKSKISQGRGPQAAQVFGCPGKVKTRQNDKVQTVQAVESPGKVDIAQHVKPQTGLKPKVARKKATKVALARLEALRERLASMEPDYSPTSAYKAAQAEVEDAKVDYYYCLYYPMGPAFSPPPPKIHVPGDGQMTATEEKTYQLWEQTKECMQEGTLKDLKEGRITWGTGPPARASDIKQITKKLRYLAMGYADVATGGSLREPTEEETRALQLDLRYCNYFPFNEEYLPLHRAKKGFRNPDNFSGGKGDLNKRAAQILKLVEQCGAEGTLELLRDGRLEQRIRNVPAATQPCLASELQVATNASRTETGSEDEATEDMTITIAPQGEVEIPDPAGLQSAKAASQLADIKENGGAPPSQIKMMGLSTEPERASRVSRIGSSSDKGLVLNTYENGRLDAVGPVHFKEAKETHQASNEIDSNRAAMNDRTASDGSDSITDADSDSEDGNGTMNHEDSEDAHEDAVRESELKSTPDLEAAQTLADLNPYDLNAQLRYFHITKTISEVDRKTPVRCLVCSYQGHMAGVCGQLTCNVCGAFNHHTTQNCPSTAKCSKCREMGHDKEHCLYKLKNLVENEILCDLCQQNGHIEENCELQWRTSGRPWESNLRDHNLRLSCYECGLPGHLGNDCPTRRPGKQLGSSTWGSGDNHISIKSKGEIIIKGTARHDPIDIDEEAAGAFIRPKVPEPIRKGKIQIKTGPKPVFNDPGMYSGWNPVNAPYISGGANESSYGRCRDDGRRDWQAVSDRHGYGSHGQSNRRSRSPDYRDHDGYDYSDRYKPPAPRPTHQGSRPLRGADLFRPMPSSALNAWSRHRV